MHVGVDGPVARSIESWVSRVAPGTLGNNLLIVRIAYMTAWNLQVLSVEGASANLGSRGSLVVPYRQVQWSVGLMLTSLVGLLPGPLTLKGRP